MLNFSSNTSYSLTPVHSPNKHLQETIISYEGFFDIHFIVQETLTLTLQIFINSVNFIIHTCDIKNKQIYYYYLLLKETVKIHQLSTSFQINFEVSLKKFQKWWIHELSNSIIPTFVNISPRIFQSGERVTGIRPSLTK